MKLGLKLLIAFLVVGMLPAAVIGYLGHVKATEALTRQTFSQLESVREAKKQSVERYFRRITDQIVTFSRDQMVVDAMRDFRVNFRSFREENDIDDAQLARMREQLLSYYTVDFANEYRNRNDGGETQSELLLEPLDDDSIAMQHHYISGNPNELGQKELLDRADDDSDYSELHGRFHPIIRDYLNRFGYYDIFLVDPETGDILYSVFKELDYSSSLIDGPYAETNFGQAFRQANESNDRDAVFLVDYQTYVPSYQDPASFIASPIFDGDKKIGVAVFQMPIDRLNEIMSERSGLGQTGETYLVGPDHLMRSDSYLDPVHHSVTASFRDTTMGQVNTEASRQALSGKSGFDVVINYNANPVFSAYSPVQVGAYTWALIAEIDEAEAFAPVAELRDTTFLVGAAALAGIFLIALLVSQLIASPIKRAIMRLTAAASSLSATSKEMIGSSQGLKTAAVNVEDSSRQLAGGAELQSSSLSVMTKSIEHIREQTDNNAETIKAADELAQNVSGTTDQGVTAMRQMGDSVRRIKSSSNESAAIIVTMNEIAAQTNLLAMNAEVQAARVGAGGEGFAVVAGEVRKLAEHSAESAQKISSIVGQSQQDTDLAVQVTEQVEALLLRIADGVEQVKAINGGVAVASSDQAAGVQQVSSTLLDLNQVTHANAKGARQFAAASTTLNSNADRLGSQASAMQQQAKQLDDIVGSLAKLVGRRQPG
jgi:methyl-accepting chemotaxis protein